MSLHHVALETRRADVEACVAFYALLGFERVPVPSGLVDVAEWLERDGRQIHLLYADDPVVPPRGHVAVVCADYDEALARVQRAGFATEERGSHWGARRCVVADPAGHVVELMAFPPPAAA